MPGITHLKLAKMIESKKNIILDAWDWCDDEDKSTEFMIQYMCDCSGLRYDDIVQYIVSPEAKKDREKYYRKRGDNKTANIFK